MELTRRSLIKDAGIAGAALTAGAVVASQASASEVQDSATDTASAAESDAPDSADLVIIGEGMGGLCAGVRALENGIANVVILEVSKWPGGGSSFSNGSVHAFGMGSTEDDYKQNTQYMSQGDLPMQSFVAITDLIDWLGTLGLPAEVAEPQDRATTSGGSNTDMPSLQMLSVDGERGYKAPINFFRSFEQLFLDNGGTVVHGALALHVLTDDNSAITGVQYQNSDGSIARIQTTQVVLSCGGWQNDQEMKQRYLGQDAWLAGVMGTPYNNSNGIRMALELGAGLQGDFTHFAGLFLPAYPAHNFMEDVDMYETYDYNSDEGGKWWFWYEIIDNFPRHSILVNAEGKRFCDEGHYRHSAERDIARQTNATAIVICDDDAYQNWMEGVVRGMPDGQGMADKIAFINSDTCGGRTFEADTLEDLADQMNATGVATYTIHKANLLATVEEYNAAASAGTAADLTPARLTNEAVPITVAPFHAVPIRNAIFATYGGVAIDTQARVLNRGRRPIAGLYATTPCAGGAMHEFYSGSIAHAGVTGMWAADTAAEVLGVK
jgi:succinate dehydrogenase/fumarate reductase flavoprotein subunit